MTIVRAASQCFSGANNQDDREVENDPAAWRIADPAEQAGT